MLWCHKALLTTTMSTLELSDITALFGVFLETNEHQNLMRLRPFCKQELSAYPWEHSAAGIFCTYCELCKWVGLFWKESFFIIVLKYVFISRVRKWRCSFFFVLKTWTDLEQLLWFFLCYTFFPFNTTSFFWIHKFIILIF